MIRPPSGGLGGWGLEFDRCGKMSALMKGLDGITGRVVIKYLCV
jgi:hypothetical protein